MSEEHFPKSVDEFVLTIAEIYKHQGRADVVQLLESAHAQFELVEYDNWNGGTRTWALRLEVPVPIYASLEKSVESIEKGITEKGVLLTRPYPNDQFGYVTVSPLASGAVKGGVRMAASELDVRRLWKVGTFRLFLSHVSKHKLLVSRLKEELRLLGVTAFVAHEDIEPSSEWRQEIELALRSMHGLAALMTSDFHESQWTDQEIGWSLGRGIPVFPIRLGVDPYGLAGKYQGLSGALEYPSKLAGTILDALLINSQTNGEMRSALVHAFVHSDSEVVSLALLPFIARVANFTDEQKELIRNACSENSQVKNAMGVPEVIYKLWGKPLPKKRPDDDIPF